VPDLEWTNDLAAAGGLANTTLYRMVAENPGHQDPKIVADKLLVIGRVYSAAVTRGAGARSEDDSDLSKTLYPHLAARIVDVQPELDRQLVQLNRLERVDASSLAAVATCHQLLADVLVTAINEWRSATSLRTVRARDSFVSKYLHFHAPMAFFILDSLAREALRMDGMRGWRVRWPVDFSKALHTPYASYCLRMLAYIERSYANQPWTPRSVDGKLLRYLPY